LGTLDFALLQFIIEESDLLHRSNIIFGLQTHCRKEVRTQDWIWKTKIVTQLLWKWPNGNSRFSALAVYYRGSDLMPQKYIIFGLQTHCRKEGRPQDWIWKTKIVTQLLWKWPNGNSWFCALAVYYRGLDLMPQKYIIFGVQTHCRKEGRPQDWIWKTKIVTQLLWKCPNGNSRFSALAVYYRGSDLMPQSDIIFGLQTHSRKEGRPTDWILSTKVSAQLFWKWPNGNSWFCALAVYYRGLNLMPRSNIIFGLQTHCRKEGRHSYWI
jgi:hypothetical protein